MDAGVHAKRKADGGVGTTGWDGRGAEECAVEGEADSAAKEGHAGIILDFGFEEGGRAPLGDSDVERVTEVRSGFLVNVLLIPTESDSINHILAGGLGRRTDLQSKVYK